MRYNHDILSGLPSTIVNASLDCPLKKASCHPILRHVGVICRYLLKKASYNDYFCCSSEF